MRASRPKGGRKAAAQAATPTELDEADVTAARRACPSICLPGIRPEAFVQTHQLALQLQRVSSTPDQILLSFSCGKESIAAWLGLRDLFPSIVPFYLYYVPGLEFIERSLDTYERIFDTEILRVPHPSRFRWLNARTFIPGDRWQDIEDLDLPEYEYEELEDAIRDGYAADDTYTAIGVRSRDSLARWASIKSHGAINHRRKAFYPMVEWMVQELDVLFTHHKCPLPVDYKMFGRSFDGIDYRFLGPIARYYPQDYARILKDFPLADLEVYRRHRLHGRGEWPMKGL